MNNWLKTILYLNNLLGKRFTRIDIECDLNSIGFDRLENYRSHLMRLGYLKHIKKNLWKVIKLIPLNITSDGKKRKRKMTKYYDVLHNCFYQNVNDMHRMGRIDVDIDYESDRMVDKRITNKKDKKIYDEVLNGKNEKSV